MALGNPRVINPQVQVGASRQEKRVGRRPETHFDLVMKPFQIQPMCLFPVLPGETMVNCALQLQSWSDPLVAKYKNAIWHGEFYMYYVKFRDLPGWEDAVDDLGKDMLDMITSGEALTTHQVGAGTAWSYCAPGGVDYVKRALERVVESYWREEGQTWDGSASAYLVDSVPIAKLWGGGRKDVHDRLTMASAYADRRAAADWDASGTLTVDDLQLAYQEWAGQKDGTELDMDYEDWQRAMGGKAVVKDDEREEVHIPEELIGIREYTWMNNTVEPSTGVPAVAAGFRWKKGTRKMFRFNELGWLLGVVCFRPKMLLKNQTGLYAGMMQQRDNWFPPNLDPRSWQPHLLIDDATGPLKATMDAGNVDYYVNLRDLMKHGEQFVNYAPDVANAPFATMPNASGDRFYPTSTDVMSVFTDTTNGRIRCGGVINVGIKTHPVVVGRDEPDSLTLAKW